MNSWLIKQLRALVLADLRDYIPAGYFEMEVESLKLNDQFKSNEYLSFEVKWGSQSIKLGKKLYFHPPTSFSPRQISASEMLMHLGMLAATEASLSALEQICEITAANNIPDENPRDVATHLRIELIPTFQSNLTVGLELYLQHLTTREVRTYLPLLPKNKQEELSNMGKEKSAVVNNTINIKDSVVGDIQTGKLNTSQKKTSPDKVQNNNIYDWILNHIVALIIAVAAGLIIIFLTT